MARRDAAASENVGADRSRALSSIDVNLFSPGNS
jgi:hypothetical protein